MSLFLWKKSYETGAPEVDVQHRRLVGMINELSDAMMERQGQKAVAHVLDELTSYIELHFDTEEALMKKCSYPGLTRHSNQHILLTRQVLEFREKFRLEHEVQSKELLDFLCSWLKNHIMVDDKEFGEYLRKITKG